MHMPMSCFSSSLYNPSLAEDPLHLPLSVSALVIAECYLCRKVLLLDFTAVNMVSALGSRMHLLPYLRLRRPRSRSARIFDAEEYPDTGPSPSQTFPTGLAGQLHNLATSHPDDGNTCSSKSVDLLNLTWICQALDVVMSTRDSVKQVLRAGTLPSEKMVQHCLEDSVKMLDACFLLKETLASAHASVKAAHRTLRRLKGLNLAKQGDIRRAQQALLLAKASLMQQGNVLLPAGDRQTARASDSTKRLQACSSMLRRMGEKLPTPPIMTLHHECQPFHFDQELKSCSSMAAVYGGEIATLFFLRLLSTALSSPRRSSSSSSPGLHLSGQPAWGPAFLALQARLQTELSHITAQRRRCGTLLPEIHTLDASLDQISEALLDVSSSSKDMQDLIHSTSLLADHLQSSMARLSSQLDCISTSLVDMRMALLDSPLARS